MNEQQLIDYLQNIIFFMDYDREVRIKLTLDGATKIVNFIQLNDRMPVTIGKRVSTIGDWLFVNISNMNDIRLFDGYYEEVE